MILPTVGPFASLRGLRIWWSSSFDESRPGGAGIETFVLNEGRCFFEFAQASWRFCGIVGEDLDEIGCEPRVPCLHHLNCVRP